MAKKKATARKTAPKDPVFEETKPVEMEEPEFYKIRYDSAVEGREFIETGIRYERNPKTGKQEKNSVIKPIRIKAGETLKLTPEQFHYLNDKGLVLDAEKKAERDKIKAKLLNVKSGREEPKQEMQVISDEDKIKIFVDLPYLVEEE